MLGNRGRFRFTQNPQVIRIVTLLKFNKEVAELDSPTLLLEVLHPFFKFTLGLFLVLYFIFKFFL